MPGLIWSRFRNHLYDKQIIKSVRFPGFVISIGNLTWGGTGKTALTLQLASFLINQKYRVAIVSRGYRRSTRGLKVVSDGSGPECKWKECGDEPFLLASKLPGATVLVAKRRIEALSYFETARVDVILLDDAFQHRKIARDLDLVLVDASENITTQRVIPFGKLREEPQSIHRADAVILTHQSEAHPETTRWFVENTKKSVFHADYVAEDPDLIRGKKIGAFCGIGAPQHFFQMLKQNGADVVASKSFPDHHRFSTQEIEKIRDVSLKNGAEFFVTTEKDAVRLDSSVHDPLLKVIPVKLQIEEEKLFYDFLMKKLHESGR
jgi:tetraacyldisaccharide 4'-kinase